MINFHSLIGRKAGGYKGIMLRFFLIVLVSIIIMTSVLVLLFRQTVIDLSVEITTSDVEKIMNSHQFQLQNIRSFSAQIYLDDYVTSFFRNNDESDYSNAMKRLRNYAEMDLYIDSIYLFNGETDKIIASNSNKVYKRGEFKNDAGLMNLLSKNNKSLVNNKVTVRKMAELGRVYYTYILYPKYNLDEAIVVNYHTNKFDFQKYSSSNINYAIVDLNGMVVSGSGLAVFDSVKDEKYFAEILKQDSISSGIVFKNNKSKIVSYYRNGDYIYLYFTDIDSLMSKVGTTLKNIIIVAIFMLLVVLIIILTSSKKPLAILQKFENQTIDEKKKNEVLQQNNRSVMIRNMFLQHELYDSEHILENLDKIKFNMSLSEEYGIIMYKIDHYKFAFTNHRHSEKEYVKFDIINRIQQVFGETFVCDVFEVYENIITIVYNTKSDSVDIIDFSKNIQSDILSSFGIDLSVIVGENNTGMDSLFSLFNKTYKASEYTFFKAKGCVILPNDEDLILDEECKFSIISLGDKIETAMKNAEYQKSCDILLEEINSLKPISPQNFIMLMNRLAIYLEQFIEKISKNGIYIEPLNLNLIFTTFKFCEKESEVIEVFYDIFDSITRSIKEAKNYSYTEMIQTVVALVEERYADPIFCSDTVVDEVKLSLRHLNSIFKQHMLTSVSDYILGYRLTKACELLINTNYTVKIISEKVGFVNNSHFNYVFKKQYGVTPQTYRLQKHNVE